jgi:hypothetical protein
LGNWDLGDYFSIARQSGTVGRNDQESDLAHRPFAYAGWAKQAKTFITGCSKEALPVTSAEDYSYFNATIGSTHMARRAGM